MGHAPQDLLRITLRKAIRDLLFILLQLELFPVVSIFEKNGICGADIADCANSDVFAGLITGIPALQAKRCFRALTAYFNKNTAVTAAAAAGGSGVSDSSVLAPPQLPVSKTSQVSASYDLKAACCHSSNCAKTTSGHTHPLLTPPQPLKDLSVDDVSALMVKLGIGYCVAVMKTEDVDGAELVEFSKNEFVGILKDNGSAKSDYLLCRLCSSL